MKGKPRSCVMKCGEEKTKERSDDRRGAVRGGG